MIIDWNVAKVIDDCRKMYAGAVDPYETGFVNWPCKQDLYRVKFAVDEMLKNTSGFAGEEEWLREQEAQRIVNILKK